MRYVLVTICFSASFYNFCSAILKNKENELLSKHAWLLAASTLLPIIFFEVVQNWKPFRYFTTFMIIFSCFMGFLDLFIKNNVGGLFLLMFFLNTWGLALLAVGFPPLFVLIFIVLFWMIYMIHFQLNIHLLIKRLKKSLKKSN